MARPRKVISSKSHPLASQQGPFPLKVLRRLEVAPLSRLSSPFLCPQAESSWPHSSPTWLQPPSLWDGHSFPLCPLPGSQLAGGHVPQILSGNSCHMSTPNLWSFSLAGPLVTWAPLSSALPFSSPSSSTGHHLVPPYRLFPMPLPRFFPQMLTEYRALESISYKLLLE